MALISCPECSRQVSDRAASCPKCGHPIARQSARDPEPQKIIIEQPPGRGGIGCGLFPILLVIAGVAAVATKPDEAALKKAVVSKFGVGFGVGAAIGEALGTAKYTYHDYFFFSTLTMKGVGGSER